MKRNIPAYVLIFTCLVGQSIAFHINAKNMPFVMISYYSVISISLFQGYMKVNKNLLLYLLGLIIATGVSFVFNLDSSLISNTSFLYLLLLYIPFCFTESLSLDLFLDRLRFFNNIMVLVGIAAIIQIATQILFHAYYDIKTIMPPFLIMDGYNTTYYAPVIHVLKSDGFFLLEPSFLSQMSAMALLFELAYFQRASFMLLFSTAIVTSFSGTGFLLLLFAFPFVFKPILLYFNKHKMIFLVTLFFFVIVLATVGDVYMHRIISQSHIRDNSASVRWVYPIYALSYLNGAHILFGYGPGSESRYPLPFYANFTPMFSILFQYGILGFVSYIGILFSLLRRNLSNGISPIVIMAVYVPYLFLSGALLQPFSVALLFILATSINITGLIRIKHGRVKKEVQHLRSKESGCDQLEAGISS